jgi:hypothetical protein
MADDLTPTDYAFLILLMIAGREISNTEMGNTFGVRLVGDDFARLNGYGYVDSKTKPTPYRHRLTPNGVKVLGDPLKIADNGTRAIAKSHASKEDKLWAALSALHAHHLRDGDRPRTPRPAPDGLDERIRAAYADLASEPGAWVSLRRLRPLLSDVSKADLDKALELLLDAPDVNLEPEPNQKKLRVADLEAAVKIGGEDRHLLAIGMR